MKFPKPMLLFSTLLSLSCAGPGSTDAIVFPDISDEQKKYWYNGEAELTSFNLTQARYGELRTGTAMMIFVTEDFSTKKYTKTDKTGEESTSVLKLNFTKNFITGIYPYSILTSTFTPFNGVERSLKVSTSVQEWCGHVYMELVRKKLYEIFVASYFEDESKANLELPVTYLEDELWSLIRLNPETIPLGKQKIIPSFSFIRLMHIDLKAYDCTLKKEEIDSANSQLSLWYADLERSLSITYQTEFPYQIIRWEEEYFDGFGDSKQKLKTTGERITTIRSAYWQKNKNSDRLLRKELGLEE